MATTLDFHMTYEADLATVGAMLMDPAFRAEVADNQGVNSHQISVADGVVAITRFFPSDRVPSFAKKFVGDEIELTQREEWDSADSPGEAEFSGGIPGKPGKVTGKMVLNESNGTTTEKISMQVEVNIPFVGGKIEDLIANLLGKGFKVEQRIGSAYLAG